jgi:hypothetical protein
VPVLTIDDILDEHRRPHRNVVVKLDIEGLETPVLRSLRDPNDPSMTLLYEDHGRDRDCEPTTWLLANTSRKVFLLLPDLPPVPITSAESLRRLKKSAKIGYNLVAIGSDEHHAG